MMEDLLEQDNLSIIFAADYVADMICFENTHDLAHILAVDSPLVAEALYNELSMWKESGRF